MSPSPIPPGGFGGRRPDPLRPVRRFLDRASPHSPARRLPRAPLQPHRRPPEGTAFLHVISARSEHGDSYQVLANCWCGDHKPLRLEPSPDRLLAPRVTLAELRSGGMPPTELMYSIGNWSDRHRALVDWLRSLHDGRHPVPALLVRDETGGDLPWELLWIDHPHEGRPTLLGALQPVSRWIVRGLELVPENREPVPGRVVGYVHDTMDSDVDAFQNFALKLNTSMREFLADLEDAAAHTGLVYVACHGHYAQDISGLRIGNLTWQELDRRPLSLVEKHRPVVFLNVCESGRLIDNSAQGERRLRGFAELFLRKGADGCIVAAGAVGDREARVLVHALMADNAREPGRPIGRFLQEFRARAAGRVDLTDLPLSRDDQGNRDDRGQKRVLSVLYAFMFHHYGHPERALALTGTGQEATT